ncbi:MAG: hypothetical protein KDA80_20155 [Planctomycetaceae bacterium]|nr:hypothetical protein [Planctomycetaceae bacterium]
MHRAQTRTSERRLGFIPGMKPISACVCAIVVGSLTVSSSCVFRGDVEVLEARLREQESLTADYQRQVTELSEELESTRRQLVQVGRAAGDGIQTVAFEAQQSLVEIKGIKFNTLLTAGQDSDGRPGDEKLHAILYPHDADGEIVKIAGNLLLEAIDPALPESRRTVGKWAIPATESKSHWHAGFLSSGYLIDSPWEESPKGETIILQATFQTPDERTFSATHTIKITPPAPDSPLSPSANRRSASKPPALQSDVFSFQEKQSWDVRTSDNFAKDEIPVYR